MTGKTKYVKEPAEAAVTLVAALIQAGKIGDDVESIIEAHRAITEGLSKPEPGPMKINPDLLQQV